MQQAAARGTPLTRATRELIELLDTYGAAEVEQAINEALAHDVPHPNAVRQVLERRREQRNQPPPLRVTLPKGRDLFDLDVALDHPAFESDRRLEAFDQCMALWGWLGFAPMPQRPDRRSPACGCHGMHSAREDGRATDWRHVPADLARAY